MHRFFVVWYQLRREKQCQFQQEVARFFAQPVETQVKSRSMFLLVFPDPAKSLDRDNSPSLSFPIHFVCVANRDPARNLILKLATFILELIERQNPQGLP